VISSGDLLLLLAATVWSFARIALGLSHHNSRDLWRTQYFCLPLWCERCSKNNNITHEIFVITHYPQVLQQSRGNPVFSPFEKGSDTSDLVSKSCATKNMEVGKIDSSQEILYNTHTVIFVKNAGTTFVFLHSGAKDPKIRGMFSFFVLDTITAIPQAEFIRKFPKNVYKCI